MAGPLLDRPDLDLIKLPGSAIMQKLLCHIGIHSFSHQQSHYKCSVCGKTIGVECLIFDFGNVIGFFDHMLACEKLAKMSSSGLTGQQVYDAIFTGGLEAQYDRGEVSTATFLEELRMRLKIDSTVPAEEVAAAWSDIFWANNEVIGLLSSLHEDCALRLVLASNTNELHYQRLSVQFADALKNFDHQILSFEIGRTKPDPEFYTRCLEAAGCEASECVYIDDLPKNVKAACDAQIRGLVFESGPNLRHRLREAGIDFVAAVNPNSVGGSAKEAAVQIYQQKYLQYRHFDILRWQVPGLVATLGALILSFGVDRARFVLPWLLLAYAGFAYLCGYFLQRITYHHDVNTSALRRVARRLGDWSVPGPTARLHPLRSAAVRFMLFVYLISAAAFVSGLWMLAVDLLKTL